MAIAVGPFNFPTRLRPAECTDWALRLKTRIDALKIGPLRYAARSPSGFFPEGIEVISKVHGHWSERA